MQLTAVISAVALSLAYLGPPPEPDDEGAGGSTMLSTADERESARPARRKGPVEGDVELRESVYMDTDATMVSTTALDGTLGPRGGPVTARFAYSVDIVSSASVDVVSAASTRWSELRNQGSLGISWAGGPWAVDAAYTLSDETDWTSHTGSASLGRDFNQRNTNVSLGYVFVHNQIYDATDSSFRDTLRTNAANATLTQVLGPRTTARVSAFYGHNLGLQSSVYRQVPIGIDPRSRCRNNSNCVDESVPELRHRFALAGTLGQSLRTRKPAGVFVSYRGYGDDWALFSHTLELQVRVELHRHWAMRLQSRTYYQDAAKFYEPAYASAQRYMSVDRELSTFIHQLAGFELSYRAGKIGGLADLRFDLEVKGSYFHFFDFPRLPYRFAVVTGAGLRLVF